MVDQPPPPIVVGIDGSDSAHRALDWAVREAQIRGCTVRVVHAWTYEPLADFVGTSSRELYLSSLALLREQITQATTGLTRPPAIEFDSIQGEPAHALCQAGRDAGMLVVGRHRGGLVRQVLLGSVSAACVRHASCPVVVVPATATRPQDTTEDARTVSHDR
ncbi:universal stress protein [Goodfellowiella coeruleoviolacea]|uniref:Nucleotide-binding universal stress protein, UspA family n=1 Tax=Goodfellowiella coeruleoviolacea TaxID=334858 RepID=A0AAE3GL28_9PSEU|nr:universal stress protein [Goodfellowiella coeruleoviolacea]MCP2170176.1 Nucleotide-binding universal stress protein, UspA family [Goodfellowiella coeruleoviolacea]